jgi:hypothetical protein
MTKTTVASPATASIESLTADATAFAIEVTRLAAAREITPFDLIDAINFNDSDTLELLAIVAHAIIASRIHPETIVTQLITDAHAVHQGRVPNLSRIIDMIGHAHAQAKLYKDNAMSELVLQTLLPDRLTYLDPCDPIVDFARKLRAGTRSLTAYEEGDHQ